MGTKHNVWNPVTKTMSVVDESELVTAPRTLPTISLRPQFIEPNYKHIVYYDKDTKKIIAHLEIAADMCDEKKLLAEHDKPENKIKAYILKKKSFKLPLTSFGEIPSDLSIDDFDDEVEQFYRGKYKDNKYIGTKDK